MPEEIPTRKYTRHGSGQEGNVVKFDLQEIIYDIHTNVTKLTADVAVLKERTGDFNKLKSDLDHMQGRSSLSTSWWGILAGAISGCASAIVGMILQNHGK